MEGSRLKCWPPLIVFLGLIFVIVSVHQQFYVPKYRSITQLIFRMTIQEAQQEVDDWIKHKGVRYFNELTNMAILTEEVGEVARLMSRIYGEQSFKKSDEGRELGDELADVLWVLICIANQTNINLTEALKKNFEKKSNRDGDRHAANEKLKG